MTRLLVDTTVFVDHIRGRVPLRARGHELFYSAITRAELFAGGKDAVVRTVLEPFAELVVDRPIAERAGRLRRETGMLLPDALIAATALQHRLGLVTRNVGDFERVRALRVRDAI